MEKSAVTEFFLKYFEENRIDKVQISENTGIKMKKLSDDYRQALTASEFLKLCACLEIEPETVREWIARHSSE